MDKLENYVIKHSACELIRCDYVENGIEIDCNECQKMMFAEHDAKIRAETIDDFQEWLKHQIVGVDNHSNEILVVLSDLWELAIDVYKGQREL